MTSPVLLLRAAGNDTPDKYESAFLAENYTPVSIPVLETVLTNTDDLTSIIQAGPGEDIKGVIITSARACEAWRNSATEAALSDSSTWDSVTFYAVGKGSASALRDMKGIPPWCLPAIIRGEESGTSEQLARFILSDLDLDSSGKQLDGRLLFLTGDKNRDTLANILESEGVRLVQLPVYETRGSQQFAGHLRRVVNDAKPEGPWWIVFFAPSAAGFVLPYLKEYFGFDGAGGEAGRKAAFVATIGPTTAEFLTSSLGIRVHAIAAKPMPIELVAAIKKYGMMTDSPYSASTSSLLPSPGRSRVGSGVSNGTGYPSSISDKYSLSPSPAQWGTPLLMDVPEPDDELHNPDPKRDRRVDRGGKYFSSRGIANLGCLFILAVGMIMLFGGYPILTHILTPTQSTLGGFNLGGINASGQVPEIPGDVGLIDRDTPRSAYTRKSLHTSEDMELVFSDEFNLDGRTFYPGDDPFWEAVDLHYWGTNDLEWYDPSQATTRGGALRLTLDRVANPLDNHDLNYRSGMVQTWNKFCFTGGLIEAAVTLPGTNNIHGLWPAVWTMGNLGRAGFGASLEGMWPYTYDTCDVGTLPNQTYPGTRLPLAAHSGGDPTADGELSYLPGQRLSACTCPGEPHPGPVKANGEYVGRGAPEIDIFEATIHDGVGSVSMSSQWAPFNAGYVWQNTSDNIQIHDGDRTILNTYAGGAFQQCTSGLSVTNQDCYELNTGCYASYGFEYKPGFDDAYITWFNDGTPSWTLIARGMGPDTAAEIGARPVPQEPMYIIANLGFSLNFGPIDFERITFPTSMSVDYIRVYQPVGKKNIGCDPVDFPTAAYINAYPGAYANPNFTLWEQYDNQVFPKNRIQNGGTCD
ncbi:hypothetical protein ONZ45_g14470 [Pleurotus djamor]|nr:hypothetical protein ONZ45_g14470 [Pleurotus djamor]